MNNFGKLLQSFLTDYIIDECNWILDNLGDSVPLHFSAFSPKYKFSDRNKTQFKTLLKARVWITNTSDIICRDFTITIYINKFVITQFCVAL